MSVDAAIRPVGQVGRRGPFGPRAWRPEGSRGVALLLALPLVAALIIGVGVPLYQLIKTSIQGQGFSAYSKVIHDHAERHALSVTVTCSLATTAIAVVIGALLAWHVHASTSRTVKVVLWLAILLPTWMGVVVKNYAFVIILGRQGVLSVALQDAHLTSGPIDLLYTKWAVIIGMVYTVLPYAVLPLYATFVNVSLDLPKAAETLGASRSRAISSVVLPLARPALFATTIISFVLSLGFYLTPVVLGGTSGTFVASLVQNDVFSFFDLPDAAALGTTLLLVATVVLSIGFWLVGSDRIRRALV
ncbi:MAG TPA: ABC transporter permease [Mycobacteriales bacterium]|jgi:putative spermidine/putrescine transport system permease protein|nr:ABC transporter permease [Mycobacteriales bacterium]